MEELLSVGQVAKQLGVTVDVVRSLEERGELKSKRTPGNHRRFHREDVERVKARWRAKQNKPKVVRASSLAPRPATTPLHQFRTVERDTDNFDIEDQVLEFEVRRVEREAERLAAKQRADAEAKAAAAVEAERQRLESLKKYGRDQATWTFLPTEWRAKVVEDLEEFATSNRLPPSLPAWEAQLIVKARVDSIIKQHREAEDQRREKEAAESRVKALIEHGKNRAWSQTITGWDSSDAKRAREDVEGELKSQVQPDWIDGDVDDLVDEVLEDWEEESEEEDDEG